MHLFLDTENSGLFDYKLRANAPGQPRLAQIGMLFTNDALEIEAEHEFLIKPEGWVFDNNSEAARVNGLTHERLMDEGVPVRDVLPMYDAAIRAGRIVNAHNAPFDTKVMRAELRHAGMDDLFMLTRTIDTMGPCRPVVKALDKRGYVKAPRLEEACAFFQIEQKGAHTALDDARCVLMIRRMLRERGIEVSPQLPKPLRGEKPPLRRFDLEPPT